MKLICALAMLLVLPSAAAADPFQFVRDASGALISHAPVYVDDVLVGYTDLYGRITIDLAGPPGDHTCAVQHLGERLQLLLPIVGTTELRVVRF